MSLIDTSVNVNQVDGYWIDETAQANGTPMKVELFISHDKCKMKQTVDGIIKEEIEFSLARDFFGN